MRENLHRFFRAARGAGVRVSPAESIDAMRAVAQVGFNDRDILRDTFLLTLAKTQDEKRALGECFDLFFSQPEPQQESAEQNRTDDNGESGANPSADEHGDTSGGAADADVGPLAQMLLSQDRAAISTAIANASGAASLPDIRYFTQRGIFQTRILDAMGIQRLRDEAHRFAITYHRTMRSSSMTVGIPRSTTTLPSPPSFSAIHFAVFAPTAMLSPATYRSWMVGSVRPRSTTAI
mgnify:CR=1 FL=1